MIRYRSFSLDTARPKGIGLLDVDGTMLLDSPDEFSGRMLWHIAETTDLIRDDNLLQHLSDLRDAHGASNVMAERRLYFDPVVETLDPLILQQKRATIQRLANEVIHKVIDNNELFPEVLAEIHTMQADGRYVGLISGSPDFLIQPLRQAIGADFATGTRFYKAGDNSFSQSRPIKPRGRDKHAIVESMLVDLSIQRLHRLGRASLDAVHRPLLTDIDPRDRFGLYSAHGDTVNDLSMLEMAERPVAVAPKHDLYEIATSNDWDIIIPAAAAHLNVQKEGIA